MYEGPSSEAAAATFGLATEFDDRLTVVLVALDDGEVIVDVSFVLLLFIQLA